MPSSDSSKSKASLSYQLFVHRAELRRPNVTARRLSKSKILLTERLIKEHVQHIEECSMEDLRAINRQITFKQELIKQLHCIQRPQLGQKRQCRSLRPRKLNLNPKQDSNFVNQSLLAFK